MNNKHFVAWHDATCFVPWGVNAVVYDALTLAAAESVKIAYNADYRDGHPCLINAVAPMLIAGGGLGVPMRNFGQLVRAFDSVNTYLESVGVNKSGIMSPLAADILLQNGNWSRGIAGTERMILNAPVKVNSTYIEPSDAEMQAAMEAIGALNADPDKALTTPYSREALPPEFYAGYDVADSLT